MQDDFKDGGGRECLEHILEVERIRTNIGHIRVKMSGANFPDRVEKDEMWASYSYPFRGRVRYHCLI